MKDWHDIYLLCSRMGGRLFDLIKTKTVEAKAAKALVSFETSWKKINDGGIDVGRLETVDFLYGNV